MRRVSTRVSAAQQRAPAAHPSSVPPPSSAPRPVCTHQVQHGLVVLLHVLHRQQAGHRERCESGERRERRAGGRPQLTCFPGAGRPTGVVAPTASRPLRQAHPLGAGRVCRGAGRTATAGQQERSAALNPPASSSPLPATLTAPPRGAGGSPDDEHRLVEHLEEGDFAQGGGRHALLLHLRKPRTPGHSTTRSAPHRCTRTPTGLLHPCQASLQLAPWLPRVPSAPPGGSS